VQAALAQRTHREGAAIASRFLSEGGAGAGSVSAPGAPPASLGGNTDSLAPAPPVAGAPAAACKVLKMGDCAMKRLRNGDIYKVRRPPQSAICSGVAEPPRSDRCQWRRLKATAWMLGA
jgi:hypothetical protein